MVFQEKPLIDPFPPWGCFAFVYKPKPTRSDKKLDLPSVEGVFIGNGLAMGRKCYYIWSPKYKCVFESAIVKLDRLYFPWRLPLERRVLSLNVASGTLFEPEPAEDFLDPFASLEELVFGKQTWCSMILRRYGICRCRMCSKSQVDSNFLMTTKNRYSQNEC